MAKKNESTTETTTKKTRAAKPLSEGAARLKVQFTEQKIVDRIVPHLSGLTEYGKGQLRAALAPEVHPSHLPSFSAAETGFED